jgi:peptide/nickel transport system permease protein
MMASAALASSPLDRIRDSDLWMVFRRSKTTSAALLTLAFALAAIAAPLIAPQNPFDPAALDLSNSLVPPLWLESGRTPYLLGTDEQGRDVLSAILYGLRISPAVGLLSVAVSAALGVSLGLVAGYFRGVADALIMRVADVQPTVPAILMALLMDGVVKSVLGGQADAMTMLGVLVASIGLSFWVQYARTVRGLTMVETKKDYVTAARLIGLSAPLILLRHLLPNVLGPVLVIATINLALAIATEATLSFVGSGMPPTTPSLGTLIRTGNNFLFSGDWWIVACPGAALAMLVLAVNLLGDGLRDALNPRLR